MAGSSVNVNKLTKTRNTKIELLVRRALFDFGFRYRIHSRELPGSPDIVLPRYRAAVFVNGCFWHGHDCHIGHLPQKNMYYWYDKICKNRHRDLTNISQLNSDGWKVLVVWECALAGKNQLPYRDMTNVVANWIQFDQQNAEILGR